MMVWIEVPEGWGWGPVRVLRGRLDDLGYYTEEHRLGWHVMLQVTATRAETAADPPAWRGSSPA